jgi:hypothetical protein
MAMNMIRIMLTSQNSTLSTALLPAELVVKRTTLGADNRPQRITIHMVLHRTGANGAMQAQTIGFDDIIIRDSK